MDTKDVAVATGIGAVLVLGGAFWWNHREASRIDNAREAAEQRRSEEIAANSARVEKQPQAGEPFPAVAQQGKEAAHATVEGGRRVYSRRGRTYRVFCRAEGDWAVQLGMAARTYARSGSGLPGGAPGAGSP